MELQHDHNICPLSEACRKLEDLDTEAEATATPAQDLADFAGSSLTIHEQDEQDAVFDSATHDEKQHASASSSMSRRRRASCKPVFDGHLFLPPLPSFTSLPAFHMSLSDSSATPPMIEPPTVDLGDVSLESKAPITPMDQVCFGHSTPPDAPRQPAKHKRLPFLGALKLPRFDEKDTTNRLSLLTPQTEELSKRDDSVSPADAQDSKLQGRSLDPIGPLRRKFLSGVPRRLSYGHAIGTPATPLSADSSSSSDSLASPVVLEAPQTYIPKRAFQVMHSPSPLKTLDPPTDRSSSPSYFTLACH